MKSLLIDVGNTSTKFAVLENQTITLVDRDCAINSIKSCDEIICSSVNKDAYVDSLLGKFKGNVVKVQTQPKSFGITNAYRNFQNLGVDRWLAVLGAENTFPKQDLIIVDAGTAMTVDILSADKVHRGGWIIPGLSLMQSAIADRAPGVFSGEPNQLEIFGTDTPSALYSGCFFALTSAIEKASALLSKDGLNKAPLVVITGGDAEVLQDGLKISSQLIPDLVFKGLARFSNATT